MATIFLSYRRKDASAVAERIHEHLQGHFGQHDVFIDVDKIPPGVDFREFLHAEVARADVVVAVIGPRWAGRAGGRRRIDHPGDFVRIELEAAFQRNIPVIPVLIDQARMPGEADLPPSLAALAFRNALTVGQGRDFRRHVGDLIQGIEYHLKRPTSAAAVSSIRTEADPPRFTNALGMTLVRIEPGEFLMGSTEAQIDMLLKQFPDTKREWVDDEQPQHPVRITRPFYLGAHQVTVGQFRRFVEASGYKTEAEASGEGAYGLVGKEWKPDKRITWRNPGFEQGENHPVVCVSHNDAVAFLAWLNDQEKGAGWTYRLPTEAEWEYGCRAGTGGLYGGSDDPESLVRIANVADASFKKAYPGAACIRGDDGFVYTAPVGSFASNTWGLYDLLGNVWEWCDDWFDAAFYKSSPKEDPRNMKGATGRVIRGGCWNGNPRSARSAYRLRFAPGLRGSDLGFRVARGRSG
jgi:formylglycine-generating enzyme required for sulfatase activity